MHWAKGILGLCLFILPLPVLAQKWLPDKKIIRREATASADQRPRRLNIIYRNPEHYVPDTAYLQHSPIRYLRLNVHFMNTRSRAYNYEGEEAIRLAKDLIYYANLDLQKNNKLWQPYRNNLPIIQPRYQYALTASAPGAPDQGVYFHYDDTLSFYIHKGPAANLDRMEVIRKYQVQGDSVLNIFIMPHHPEHQGGGVGVMLGNAIKMAGMFESKQPAWVYRGILNHEVGHFLGLAHAFYNDGCDDTPAHGNPCWNQTPDPPCDTAASNNMMDYNALQNALSPCQIGTMQARMADTSSSERRFLIPYWCKRLPDYDLTITDTIVWKGDKDLYGNLTIVAGAVLRIQARVSLPENTRITIEPGGRLELGSGALLHNACGLSWEGIDAPRRFLGARGKVVAEEGARIRGAKTISF